MNRRRRLAVLLAGVVAASGLAVLPAAQADEARSTTIDVPARQWGCLWLDTVDLTVCLSG